MTVTGVFFAIAVAKQVYGGLGFNIFNPAMIAYVVLLISFPAAMSLWLPPATHAGITPSFFDSVSLIFTGFTTSGYDVTQLKTIADGVTMATPLDTTANAPNIRPFLARLSFIISVYLDL